jgi:carbonic anhydrase
VPVTRRSFLLATAAIPALAQHHDEAPQPPAAEVLRDLTEGNARFASGAPKHPHAGLDRVHEVAGAQRPHAVILTCSDSRVPPEVVFDQGIGDLFVVRVAGNVANNDQIGSSEYAIEHFNSPLLVVLGHSQCGAVSAVVNGDAVSKDIGRMVVHIGESVTKVRKDRPMLKGTDLVAASVQANVQKTVEDLRRGSDIIGGRVRDGKLKIVGGVYNLADGKVAWV